MRQSLAGLIYALSGALGVFAFLAPFLLPSIGEESMQGQLAPLLTAALVGLGALFFLRAGAALVGALVGGTPLPLAELAVLVADLLVTPL